MGSSVLVVKDLRKTYRRGFAQKKVEALKGVSFEIKAGTITGFLGANGAGKTTTIKCLLNLAFADGGDVLYFGRPGLTPEAKARIGFLPERPYFYEYLTGYEFLKFYADLSVTNLTRLQLQERIARLLKRVGLDHAKDRPLRSYSKGMLQRIGIAQALVHEPEFVILDEPQTGLDPDGRMEIRNIIRETANAGTAVFFSSHLLPDAEELCSDLVILKKGELIYNGTTSGLLNRVEHGYTVTYSRAGRPETAAAATVAELQAEIDRIRLSKGEILEIRPERVGLEEAFISMAFDKKEANP